VTPATSFAGRRVALFGLGGSGFATAEALRAGGANVAVWDDSAAARERAAAAGHAVVDLKTCDWSRFAALILSPGVPLTHPEPHWTVTYAETAGIEVIGDIELFCRERARRAPRAPFFAITGTNGKSTTTALLARLLRFFGQTVEMGGNIGTPILALDPPVDDRCHVIELSTFQIDLTPSLRPSVGVLLNLTPDHIDRHGTMENYAAIKERLVARSDRAVIAVDDPFCASIADRLQAQGRPVTRISTSGVQLADGLVLDGTRIVQHTSGRAPDILADLASLPNLRGRHNAQNAAAAIAAMGPVLFAGADLRHPEPAAQQPSRRTQDLGASTRPLGRSAQHDESVETAGSESSLAAALRSFPGLSHRMEQVGQRGRVLFINDSKATNADAAEQSLKAFRDIHWIVGGVAKEGGLEPLRPLFDRVAKAYLIGKSSGEFAAQIGRSLPVQNCGTLEAAVQAAASDAAQSRAIEPVVLLAPACASYDQFKNFEERGERFRSLVAALPSTETPA
jgi:UDP-N-acetylmuramoylalanine--D-glutamate ligase